MIETACAVLGHNVSTLYKVKLMFVLGVLSSWHFYSNKGDIIIGVGWGEGIFNKEETGEIVFFIFTSWLTSWHVDTPYVPIIRNKRCICLLRLSPQITPAFEWAIRLCSEDNTWNQSAWSVSHTHTQNINNKDAIYYWWQSTLPLIVPINYYTWELMVDDILIMLLCSNAGVP